MEQSGKAKDECLLRGSLLPTVCRFDAKVCGGLNAFCKVQYRFTSDAGKKWLDVKSQNISKKDANLYGALRRIQHNGDCI